jgi:hypothetical protein
VLDAYEKYLALYRSACTSNGFITSLVKVQLLRFARTFRLCARDFNLVLLEAPIKRLMANILNRSGLL